MAASTELPGSQLAELANLAKHAAKSSGKNRLVIWKDGVPVSFAGSELFGVPLAPAADGETDDRPERGPGADDVRYLRELLVEAREKRRTVELNSSLEIELEQTDTGGRRVRVELLFDRPITVWQVHERTFDLGIRRRDAATPTVAPIPLSHVDNIWVDEPVLHVSLRKVLLLQRGTFVLVDSSK